MNIIFSNYKKLLLPILFSLLLIAFLTLPSLSSAQGLKDIDAGIDTTAQGAGVMNDINAAQFVAILINSLLGVLALIFVILIIFGGVQWMTAMGNEDKVLKAKKVMINSVVGLLIIILSYGIATFVFTSLENNK